VHAPSRHQGQRECIYLEARWPPFYVKFQSEFRVLFLSRAAQASFVLARHLVPLSVVSDRPMYRSIYVYVYVCICIQIYIRTRTAPLCTRLSSCVLLTLASRAARRALQLAKYCALYSSKGYAVGIKAQKWMLAEEHVKTDELSNELGSTQQARRRWHDLVRQPALGFRWHGPLPHCVERLPG